jgi:hypothetical protein
MRDSVAKIEKELLARIDWHSKEKSKFSKDTMEYVKHDVSEESLNDFLDWIKYTME